MATYWQKTVENAKKKYLQIIICQWLSRALSLKAKSAVYAELAALLQNLENQEVF